MMYLLQHIDGLIFIIGGCVGLLLVYRKWAVKPEHEDDMETWHKSYGKLMKILSPILIVFGVIMLSGIMD